MIHDFWCLITFIFLSPNVVKLSLLYIQSDFFFDRFKMDVVPRAIFLLRESNQDRIMGGGPFF